jgi:exopolysaccharide production protein ExoZ
MGSLRVRLQSIQFLRAIAALLVLLFHLSDGRIVTGASGVDIFFVISGFIMGTVGVGERPRDFIVKRAARIVPLYWLITMAMCIGALLGVFSRFSYDIESLVKSLLFIPYYDASGHIWPLVVPGWTLNLEALFYILFAGGLLFGAPIAFCVVALAVLAAVGQLTPFEWAPLRLWTSPC